MNECFYQNAALEGRLCSWLYTATGYDPYSPIVERRIDETAAILKSEQGSLFAIVGELVKVSREWGYPLSFRGYAGSLLCSHLLGFAQNNPMELGIPWQGAFYPSGRMPHLTLNVAPEIYRDVRRYLKARIEDCNVLWDLPDLPPYRVVFAPEVYDPSHRYLFLDIPPHDLMSQVGKAAKKAGGLPRIEEIQSPDFIRWLWTADVWDMLILRDMVPLRDYAPELEPRSFSHLIRLLGLSLAPETWKQLREPGADLDTVIATREDIYEHCLQNGSSPEEALATMRKARKPYRYTRGQCAEYLTYALILAWFRENGG